MQLTSFSDSSPQGVFLMHALKDLTLNGPQNLCPDRVAELSGVNSIYENADELKLALAKLGFHELEGRMRSATPSSLPFEERLFQTCRAYMEMASESPALLQLMFGLKETSQGPTSEELKAAGDKAFAVIEDMMKDGIAKDQLKTNDSRTAALATWSFIHGFSFLMIRAGKTYQEHPDDLMDMYQKLHRLLSKGLISAKPN